MAFPNGVKVDILINGQPVEERNCFICDTETPVLFKFIDVPHGAHFSVRVSLDTHILTNPERGTSFIVQLESAKTPRVPLTSLFSSKEIERFALGTSHVFHGHFTQGENNVEILHPFVFECKKDNCIGVSLRRVRNKRLSKVRGRPKVEHGLGSHRQGQLVAVEVPPDGPGVYSQSHVYGDPWLHFTFQYDLYGMQFDPG
ncbi:MAG: hypothetical protein Q9183_006839 [Haloplaca sp. 2 TL-2023]